jgi:hypothetical protein
MPNPAELGPGAVPLPEPQSYEATVLDDATATGQEVRCSRPSLDELLADDPMPWTPYVTEAGVFYPKRGDRAIVGFPDGGTPVISQWWPGEAAEPDHPFI